MNPKRLIPYVVIFLILVGGYVALLWQQGQKTTREEQAKTFFQVKEGQIEELSLVRGQVAIHLVKKDKQWYLTEPLQTKADQPVVDSMLLTLAHLRKERTLGAEKDLKNFGLDHPPLIVKFSAQGKPYQLVIGGKVPGGQGYYALQNQGPDIVIISAGSKDSLDRDLFSLRDKTLLAFITAEVEAIKIHAGKNLVELKKTGPQTWSWVGRPDFKVRGERVEKLLRDLQAARVKEFPTTQPKNLRVVGLEPRRQTEVTVVTKDGGETLFLGANKAEMVYARRGATGPVVLVDSTLPEEISKAATSLEDRRLWAGPIPEVEKMAWGAPGKTWTAVKEKDFWKIGGPEKSEVKQPAMRIEIALWNLQKLEYSKILHPPGARGRTKTWVLDLFDGAGKPLFHLEDLGKSGKDETLTLSRVGDKAITGLVPQKQFAGWQEEMARLTTPPPPEPSKPRE